jgi:hypothetical protein
VRTTTRIHQSRFSREKEREEREDATRTHPGLTIGLVVFTNVSTLPSLNVVVLNSSTPVESRLTLAPADEAAAPSEVEVVVGTATYAPSRVPIVKPL